MTIDQLNEIQEWLSPLDDCSVFNYTLQAEVGWAEAAIDGPDGHICDLSFYVKDDKIEVDNISESTTNIAYTSVWEQIFFASFAKRVSELLAQMK